MTMLKAIFGACLLLSCGGHKPAETEERKVITETKVEVFGPIRFSEGSTLSEESHPIIEAIAKTMIGNPEIVELAVIAPAQTQELSTSRGQVVIDELIEHGVAAERLMNQPKESTNEDVDLLILRRASDDTAK